MNLKRYLTVAGPAMKTFILDRQRTFCPLLWDSVFIDQYGNVFTCCHYQPGVLGNIYSQDLSWIWTKSRQLSLFRWMSLNRCLPCFHGCTLLSTTQKASKASPVNILLHPKRLRILFGEFCNVDCIMCDQDHHSKVVLDQEIVRKNINFSMIEEIDFQGGEILAMKNAREMYLWLTVELHKKVNLITNGVLINDEWADHLVKGSNWIQISANAATRETHETINRNSSFTRVVDNIRKLTRLKNEYGSGVNIVYKFTIVPENIHEVSDAIKLADDLGCDQIAFGFDASMPGYLQDERQLKETIKSRIARIRNNGLKIDIENKRLEQLGLL